MENIIAFDITVIIQIAAFSSRSQQFSGFSHIFAAFDVFFADIEQTHSGVFIAIEHRHQGRTHHSKLKQMLGTAVHIGAHIEHGGGTTLGVGELSCNGWTVNAFKGFQHIAGNGHQGTSIASRYGCIRLAITHLLDGDTHGGVFFAPQGDFKGVFHGHHLRGGDYVCPGMVKVRQGLGQSNQKQLGIWMRL